MTSLDVLSLRGEMSALVGGYVDKAFGGNPFSIRFSTESGKREVVVYDQLFVFLSDPLEKSEGAVIGPLASTIRRRLDNSRVKEVRQHGFDRLITLEFSRPEGMIASIELMGKGNFILVESGKVVSASRYEKRKGHEIFPGSQYSLPSLRFDVLRAGFEDFLSTVMNSKGDTVRTLATVIGLGGDLAEEVCTRTGVKYQARPEQVSRADWEAIRNAIIEITSRVASAPEPVVYYADGKAVQFTPVPFTVFDHLEKKRFGSLSECVLEFIRNRPVEETTPEEVRAARLVEKQKEAIGRLRHEMAVTREFADSIYADYEGFRSMLGSIKTGNQAARPYTRNRDGTCTLKIEDVEITLNPSDDINRVASSIYDAAKELDRKVKRAEEALEEISSRKGQGVQKAEAPEIRKKRKKFWFDGYRWFVSSDGTLVIAGRDARSNDSLVSKHMSDHDRYAHADVYGAPSVVVKWAEGSGEDTLEEACSFALCFSRAWNAQIGAASAYWVMPDQVSKTPESGEFLPRGAFIIRGKRNYFNKLNLELGLGIVDYLGEKRLQCAPVRALAANSDFYYRLVPGDKTKETVAAELASKLGVAKDDVVSVLPPGKSSYSGPEKAENRKKEKV